VSPRGKYVSARGNDPKPPFELWKFGKVNGEGKMPVEFSETLTPDWLESKWLLVDGECQKVVECRCNETEG
jgi:hypothetical protein